LATIPFNEALSEIISDSNFKFSRLDMIATPWSPIVPDTIILSPTCALSPEICKFSDRIPTPAVLINTPSAFPFSTT